MAKTIKQYWEGVNRAEQAIVAEKGPVEDVFLVSEEDVSVGSKGGVVSHVSRRTAAKLISEKVARLATDQEIVEHRKLEKERAKINAERQKEIILSQNPMAALVEASKPKKESEK